MATVEGFYGRGRETAQGVEEQVWCGACDWRATVVAANRVAATGAGASEFIAHARASHPGDDPTFIPPRASIGDRVGTALVGVALLGFVVLLVALLAQAWLVVVVVVVVAAVIAVFMLVPDLGPALAYLSFFVFAIVFAVYMLR